MEKVEEPHDLRDEIFKGIEQKQVTAAVLAEGDGLVSGSEAAVAAAQELGLRVERMLEEGSEVKKDAEVARFTGTPKQIALAEEVVIGHLAKPSGIATAARACVKAAGKRPRVVCGAWKKMPPGDKDAVRLAVTTGGALDRVTPGPFIYLDKNCVEMFGGVRESIEAVSGISEGRTVVVQVKGRYASVAREAVEAAEAGAGVVFVDTGVLLDVMETAYELERAGLRKKVKVAFGGNITLKELRKLKGQDIDIVDVGREIADAPLLDMRLEVVEIQD